MTIDELIQQVTPGEASVLETAREELREAEAVLTTVTARRPHLPAEESAAFWSCLIRREVVNGMVKAFEEHHG